MSVCFQFTLSVLNVCLESLHLELEVVSLKSDTSPCTCISASSGDNSIQTSFCHQNYRYRTIDTAETRELMKWLSMTVLLVGRSYFGVKWLGQEGNGHQSVSGPHASHAQFLCPKHFKCSIIFPELSPCCPSMHKTAFHASQVTSRWTSRWC